jgi:hypothetical protein
MRRKGNDEKVKILKETDFTFILIPSPEENAESDKTLSKIHGNPQDIRTGYLWHISLHCYRYTDLFGVYETIMLHNKIERCFHFQSHICLRVTLSSVFRRLGKIAKSDY